MLYFYHPTNLNLRFEPAMQIAVAADSIHRSAFSAKPVPAGVDIIFIEENDAVSDAALYIDFCFEEKGDRFAAITEKPVLVNAVLTVSTELSPNKIRFNGWNGFFERSLLEIAGNNDYWLKQAENYLGELGWQYKIVPDVPGMIAPRVIAMIINEAYFGLGDDLSTKSAIDTAMKLGTNYPYGPFEWCEKIGTDKIHHLLKKLAEKNSRYTPAPLLEKEAKKQ